MGVDEQSHRNISLILDPFSDVKWADLFFHHVTIFEKKTGRDKRRTTRGWTTPSTKTKTKGTSGGRQILQEPDKNDGGHHDHCRHHHDAITSTSTTKEEISDVVGGPATPDNVGDPRAGKSNVVEVLMK